MPASAEEVTNVHLALDEELRSLDEKETWEPSVVPDSSGVLPTHFLLKIKRIADGFVEIFKACIVTGGKFEV